MEDGATWTAAQRLQLQVLAQQESSWAAVAAALPGRVHSAEACRHEYDRQRTRIGESLPPAFGAAPRDRAAPVVTLSTDPAGAAPRPPAPRGARPQPPPLASPAAPAVRAATDAPRSGCRRPAAAAALAPTLRAAFQPPAAPGSLPRPLPRPLTEASPVARPTAVLLPRQGRRRPDGRARYHRLGSDLPRPELRRFVGGARTPDCGGGGACGGGGRWRGGGGRWRGGGGGGACAAAGSWVGLGGGAERGACGRVDGRGGASWGEAGGGAGWDDDASGGDDAGGWNDEAGGWVEGWGEEAGGWGEEAGCGWAEECDDAGECDELDATGLEFLAGATGAELGPAARGGGGRRARWVLTTGSRSSSTTRVSTPTRAATLARARRAGAQPRRRSRRGRRSQIASAGGSGRGRPPSLVPDRSPATYFNYRVLHGTVC